MSEQPTKLCECGKNMVLRGRTPMMSFPTYPAQYPTNWYCAGCNMSIDGPTIVGATEQYMADEEWRRANL